MDSVGVCVRCVCVCVRVRVRVSLEHNFSLTHAYPDPQPHPRPHPHHTTHYRSDIGHRPDGPVPAPRTPDPVSGHVCTHLLQRNDVEEVDREEDGEDGRADDEHVDIHEIQLPINEKVVVVTRGKGKGSWW